MVDFNNMSREQVEQLIAELASRTAMWELRERHDWQVRELERLAAMQGPIS